MKFFTLNDGTISKSKITAVVTALIGLLLALGVKPPSWLDADQIAGVVTIIASLFVHFQRSGTDRGPTKP
jgi:hypothetical protein